MKGITKLTQKINIALKHSVALMIVFTLVIPQNLFANPGDGLSPDHLNFNKALTPTEMKEIGIEEGSISSYNTTGELNGMKVDLDVIQGQFKAEEADKLVKVLQQLEPEIRSAYEHDPSTKFKFIYVSDETENHISIQAQEILDLLTDINNKTFVDHEKINLSVADRLRSIYSKIFGQTTKSDFYWGVTRTVVNGTSATLSFHLGSGIPMPASLFLGGIIGVGSGGVGFFINKYTAWLENNKTDPTRGVFSRLSSAETFMFVSPLLIGLQDTGLNSVGGAAVIAGTATASVIVQNVYYSIKKRSPQAAMWYKWYATEALFLTMPYLIAPKFDIYAENVIQTIESTALTALFSTMSQGVWDVFITAKLRRPSLEAAIKKDVAELSQRLSGVNVFEMSDKEIDRLAHLEANRVKERFKKYYFMASAISVASAVATNTGIYMGIPMLKTAGIGGLAVLGASGVISWAFVAFKNRNKNKSVETPLASTPEAEPIRACSLLFSM